MSAIEIGRISRPHGVRGELRVRLFWPASDALGRVQQVELANSDGQRAMHRVVRARPAGDHWLLSLSGVGDRDGAERLVGCRVLVERDQLGPLGEGEYYLVDLVDCVVVGPEGLVGSVVDVHSYPTLDVMVIRRPDGTLLEQVVDEPWVVSVDLTERRVILSSLDGIVE